MASETKSQKELLYFYTLWSVAILLLFGLLYYLYFKSYSIGVACAIFAGLCSLTPMIYALSRSYQFGIAYLLLSSIGVVVYSSIYTGGIQSPILFWITALPLTGAFLSRAPWSSVKWSLVSIVCFAFVYSYPYLFGVASDVIDVSLRRDVSICAALGILSYNVLFTQKFESMLSAEASKLASALSQLKEAQDLLVYSEKMKTLGTFSSGLSHELLNNLNISITTIPLLELYVEGISDSAQKQEARDAVKRLENSIDQSIEICEGFRSYNGDERSKFKHVKIKGPISSVATMLKHKADQAKIKVELAGDAELSVFGNESRLHQVFMNLFSNAIDAMKNGGTITSRWYGDGDSCIIVVADTGSGMSDEVKARIFDPFFTTKSVGEGTGLGLSIVKRIIEEHGGKIFVNSKINKGTEFTLSLPIKGKLYEDHNIS